MSNQIQTKAAALANILAANSLLKEAEQTITHKSVLSQDNLGREQTNEIHENVNGVIADTRAAANKSTDKVDEVVGAQSLNRTAEQALNNSGNEVNTMNSDGNTKSAAYYRNRLASIIGAHDKRASLHNQINDFRTGTEVMQKFASLTASSTDADILDAEYDLLKLAASNPVFQVCKEHVMMRKMAEDIMALADAEGIGEEQAAQELQAAADANPEMMQDLEDEATGEAVADLAAAEAETADFMQQIQGLADNASANLGVEVTADDIIQAADETQALADELGVPAEALIQEALNEMSGGAGVDVTPEEEAAAQAILDEAAANGISPEEVIQYATEELAGEPAQEAPVEKAASLQKRAGTMRAAFVQELRNRY